MCQRYYIEPEDPKLISIIEPIKPSVKTGEIFPTDIAAVIANNRALNARPFAMRWGFAQNGRKAVFNARSETAGVKPMFSNSFLNRRCLVPASRFFEWKSDCGHKTKYAIWLKDDSMLFMAGLYRLAGDKPEFVILTRESLLPEIHDRMPVIIPSQLAERWLSPGPAPTDIMDICCELSFKEAM